MNGEFVDKFYGHRRIIVFALGSWTRKVAAKASAGALLDRKVPLSYLPTYPGITKARGMFP